jgi:S-adenosylmethionine hydrolase
MTDPIITLTTDFGTADEYVGAVKGVLLTVLGNANIIDITHAIPPQDVLRASRIIAGSAPFFPPATVHLAIVDPGVGSDRRIIAVHSAGHTFVGPDNGIFTPFLRPGSTIVHHVTNQRLFRSPISPSFHGRDIMAPVAARLAGGMDIAEVGPPVPLESCVRLSESEPCRSGAQLVGRVIAKDNFGNLRTNLPGQRVEEFAGDGMVTFQIGKLVIDGLNSVYAEQQRGELIALTDSQGFIEIAVVGGDAASVTGIGIGGEVIVSRQCR